MSELKPPRAREAAGARRRLRRGSVLGAVLAAAGSLAAPAAAGTIRVFAASSLTEAFRDLAVAFEASAAARVELQFAGSQVLRTQIERGAEADVFASADLEHARSLAGQGLLGPTRVFARNRVVVVRPADGGRRVATLADLARPGVRVVMAGPAVPAGRYAAQALRRLEREGGLGSGFAARLRANVVSEETNVRAALSKVVLGEADAAFVYATDAASASGRVRVLDLPVDVAVEYPIGVVTRSRAAAAAASFVDFVLAPAGQAILARHGFR